MYPYDLTVYVSIERLGGDLNSGFMLLFNMSMIPFRTAKLMTLDFIMDFRLIMEAATWLFFEGVSVEVTCNGYWRSYGQPVR